ncbi:glutamate racemase [Reichenbachiella sp.]|uniref:glutamate racemase n=1 Tax=Reichenbachiella sp. TaxID=2184521 RepID=UPI003BB065BC
MKYPIGILDYGVGGIDLTKKVKSRNPNVPLLYFSDSGEIPYGKLSYPKLRKRVRSILDFMFLQGVEHIVVACHSASSVIVSSDQNVTSITKSTIQAVLDSNVKTLGIIGGGRTIRSQKYRLPFKNTDIKIKQRVAQEFSILIEAGVVEGSNINKSIEKILKPLKDQESILLACTHYPVIANQIQEYIGKEKTLIDPIEHIYGTIKPKLKNQNGKSDLFYTSGDAELMKKAAKGAFNFKIEKVKRIDI